MGQCETQMHRSCSRCSDRAGIVGQGISNSMPSMMEFMPEDCAPRCHAGIHRTAICAAECIDQGVEEEEKQEKQDVDSNGNKFRFSHDDMALMPEKWGVSDWHEENKENTGEGVDKRGVVQRHERHKIRQMYKMDEKTLGVGSYGVCVKAVCNATGIDRAVKIVPKVNQNQLKWAKEEIRILALLDHVHIITLVETLQDATNVYMVMDLCEGGTVTQHLENKGHFSELQSLALVKQVLLAVQYLHSIYICHRDCKPDNFLLEAKCPIEAAYLKMIDFGMSCEFSPGEMLTRKAGTPFFMAPEVIRARYTESCDLWSCGVMLYLFLCGNYPFDGDTVLEITQKIDKGNFNLQGDNWAEVSENSKQLVRGLLKHNPERRLTAEAALSSEVITNRVPALHASL